MAKKTSRPEAPRFDDSRYEGVLFSATFDYDELAFTRAAALLCPRAKVALTAASFVLLAAVVGLLLLDPNAIAPALVIVAVWIALTTVSNNWGKIVLRYAGSSTLAPSDLLAGEKRHVVVTENEVHTQSSGGPEAAYALSELRRVYYTEDHLVAVFGGKRYVYVPRASLSENRYRDLGRLLEARVGK